MPHTQDIVSIKNFSKYFGSIQAVMDVSFSVKKGEIFAFLGANGSGKTTTIRSLLGIYSATDTASRGWNTKTASACVNFYPLQHVENLS